MHAAKKNKIYTKIKLNFFCHMCKDKTKKKEEEAIATTLKLKSLISLHEIN